MMSVDILKVYPQDDKREGNLKNLDSLTTENNFNFGLIQSMASKNLLFPRLNIPISELKTLTLFTFDVNNTFSPSMSSNNNYSTRFQFIENQPIICNFYKLQINRIFDKFYIYSSSRQVTHIGYSEYFQISGSVRWMPYNGLSFDAGGFLCRQINTLSTIHSDIKGINTQIRFFVTDKIQFNIFGQYIVPTEQNIFYGYALSPNSNIGSSLSYKCRKNMQIDVGVKYQNYESNKSWDKESGGKIKVGF
jgi:hypothetical protein